MGPKVPSLVDRQGVSLVNLIFTRDIGWFFREQQTSDVGIDAIVEVVSGGFATGELVALQIKSGESYCRERTEDGLLFRGNDQHLQYWLRYQIPVLLILFSPERNLCWWQLIDYSQVSYTGKGWKTAVPFANQLGKKSTEPILVSVKSWRASRRERGLPAEDELSTVFYWLGRCKLVHRLDPFLYSPEVSSHYQVPSLLAVFDLEGTDVPVLIAVTDQPRGGIPSWEPSYVEALGRYADLVGLPVLIALKYLSFWTIFDPRHLENVNKRLTISFPEAMKESLLSLLAGDFSFSFRPGVGAHIKIRKLKETSDGGFDGVVEEAYLQNAEGKKHSGSDGILQLFTCIEQEVQVQEDETHVTQSFIIPASGQGEFAHRVLVTALETFDNEDPIDWHHVYIRKQRFLLFSSPQEAVRIGLKEGFIQRKFTIRPRTVPDFLSIGAKRSNADE